MHWYHLYECTLSFWGEITRSYISLKILRMKVSRRKTQRLYSVLVTPTSKPKFNFQKKYKHQSAIQEVNALFDANFSPCIFLPFFAGRLILFFFTSKKWGYPILFFIDVESIRKLRWVPFLKMRFFFFFSIFNFLWHQVLIDLFFCKTKSQLNITVEKHGHESRPRHWDARTCKSIKISL